MMHDRNHEIAYLMARKFCAAVPMRKARCAFLLLGCKRVVEMRCAGTTGKTRAEVNKSFSVNKCKDFL